MQFEFSDGPGFSGYLAFTHPATSQRMSFQSDLPEDLLALRAALSDL
jgi:hypothetical protein